VETVYEVPLVFHRQGLDDIIVKLLGLEPRSTTSDGGRTSSSA